MNQHANETACYTFCYHHILYSLSTVFHKQSVYFYSVFECHIIPMIDIHNIKIHSLT